MFNKPQNDVKKLFRILFVCLIAVSMLISTMGCLLGGGGGGGGIGSGTPSVNFDDQTATAIAPVFWQFLTAQPTQYGGGQ